MNSKLSRNFGSDNVTPVCPPIMAAINAANSGMLPSYGADEFTEKLQRAASTVFEREVAIYPVATGTAANALALAQLAPPFGGIYCHSSAHIVPAHERVEDLVMVLVAQEQIAGKLEPCAGG